MKTLTPREAKQKIERYCAYQERSHQEVRNKLYDYGLYRNDVDEILSTLITDGFLNEERFAKAFTGGKFRMKKWGRIKIKHALESKGLSANCIRIGLKEIDDGEYVSTLRQLLEEKANILDIDDPFILRDKLSGYAIQKGYEPDLVWREIYSLMPKK
ncbi:MAG TPA: regulatory protein RecX [Chryseosolibacter sp.]|nr:regulatory protein RecX [Chryseosolibacter sp.]